MQLANKLKALLSADRALTTREAFVGTLVCACRCDGHMADCELQSLVTCMLRMKLYNGLDGKSCGALIDKTNQRYDEKGIDAFLQSCISVLPSELANSAFANACNVVLSDGVVGQLEKEFIDKLAGMLSLEPSRAKKIAEFIIVKNRG